MEFKIRSFYELNSLFCCVLFGSGIDDPGIDQSGEDRVKIIGKIMFSLDSCTDLMEAKVVVDILQEKVTGIKGPLFVQRDRPDWGKVDGDSGFILLCFLIFNYSTLKDPGGIYGQTKEIDLTKVEIREMVKHLEPGTMITMEMPVSEKDMGKEESTD